MAKVTECPVIRRRPLPQTERALSDLPRRLRGRVAGRAAGRVTTAMLTIVTALLTYQAVVKVSTACEARRNAPRRLRDTEMSYGPLGVSAFSVALWCLAVRGSDFRHGLRCAAHGEGEVVAVGFFVARKNSVLIPDHLSLIATVATTTVVWVSVTLLGPQTRRETLKALTRVVPERRPSSKRQAGRIRRAASAERSGDNRPPWLLRFCAEPPEGAGPAKTMPGGEIALHSPSGCAPAAAEAPPYLSTCRLTGGDV